MFKTYEYVDKFLYSPLNDEIITGGGSDITKENYNILGDDITSEASDIILGAENCCTRDYPEVCTANSCREDYGCPTNCTIDRPIAIKDFDTPCLDDGGGTTGTTKQTGYVLTYIGVTVYGYLSGQTGSKYEVNWLSGYTDNWGYVKLYVNTGGTMPCNYASSTTGRVLTQSGTSNYYYTYYTTYVTDVFAYTGSYSTNISAKIDIPGHYQATCNFTQRVTTGLTTAYCLTAFEAFHSAGTPASAMCNQITISHSTGGNPNSYNNLKYGNVTYVMYSPNSQSVSEPVQVYTSYKTTTAVEMSPSIVVHCPYKYFLVSRSRPGITYPIKAVCNVDTINGSSSKRFYDFVSNTVTASTEVATLADLKSMVLRGTPTGYTSVNNDDVCLSTALSTYSNASYPFGFYCSGYTKTSNKVLLASEILSVHPSALPVLFGSSYNAGTWPSLKTYVSVAPTIHIQS